MKQSEFFTLLAAGAAARDAAEANRRLDLLMTPAQRAQHATQEGGAGCLGLIALVAVVIGLFSYCSWQLDHQTKWHPDESHAAPLSAAKIQAPASTPIPVVVQAPQAEASLTQEQRQNGDAFKVQTEAGLTPQERQDVHAFDAWNWSNGGPPQQLVNACGKRAQAAAQILSSTAHKWLRKYPGLKRTYLDMRGKAKEKEIFEELERKIQATIPADVRWFLTNRCNDAEVK